MIKKFIILVILAFKEWHPTKDKPFVLRAVFTKPDTHNLQYLVHCSYNYFDYFFLLDLNGNVPSITTVTLLLYNELLPIFSKRYYDEG